MNSLEDIAKAKPLKSQIFKAINSNKLHTMPHLLRHNQKTEKKHIPFKSQQTENRSNENSPNVKAELSVPNFSRSPTHKIQGKSSIRESREKTIQFQQDSSLRKKSQSKDKHQKTIKSMYVSSISCKVEKERQRIIKEAVKSKHSNVSSKCEKDSSKSKNRKNVSKHKLIQQIHLQSILEKSNSDEKNGTPTMKKNRKKNIKNTHNLIESQTKKKQKNEIFTSIFKKKLNKCFKQPQVLQSLLKCDAIKLNFRILTKKLIQIQLYTLKAIECLKISLQKGNLQCQKINQEYNQLPSNTVLSLFSSVRGLDFSNLVDFPKIVVEIDMGQNQLKIKRELSLPYTWLHFVDERKLGNSKKSKIKTKLILQELPLIPKNFQVLSNIFHNWTKQSSKEGYEHQSSFNCLNNDFHLKIYEYGQSFDIQLQGKGEDRLTKMLQFFTQLLA